MIDDADVPDALGGTEEAFMEAESGEAERRERLTMSRRLTSERAVNDDTGMDEDTKWL